MKRRAQEAAQGVLDLLAGKERRGLAASIMLMKIVAVVTFVTLLMTIFSIRANLHIEEAALTDPSLPLLQAISYSSVDLSDECVGVNTAGAMSASGCPPQRVYYLLTLAAAASQEEVEVCGGTCNVKEIVGNRLKFYKTDLKEEFGFSLKNATREVVFETGNTPEVVSASGKTITEVKAKEYLIPLPLVNNSASSAYALLTEVTTK